MRYGFSLVELSIVLVILGLLVGGVLTGQSLIRAAELRSVSTEFSKYQAAVNTFRDKYFQLPGDMNNATSFWGATAACPGTAGTGTQTCDGNGSGIIANPAAASQYGETLTFWQHLQNAGLLEGRLSGMAAAGGATDMDIGVNIPRSKFPNAGWAAWNSPDSTVDANWFGLGHYGNVFIFGSERASTAPHGAALSVDEAWNIDTKMDDGLAVQGKIVTWKGTTSVTPNCATTDVVSTAVYNLSYSGAACSLIFRDPF